MRRHAGVNRFRMSSSSSSSESRIQQTLQGIPLGTLTILAVNIGIFVAQSLFDFSVGEYAIAAAPVLYNGEIYRIYTAALLHGGLMHIGMNMMSAMSLGSALESIFGTGPFMILILWMMTLGGSLYVGVSWVLHFLPSPVGGMATLYQPAVGFSGVIFSMAVLETALSPFPTRSVFGLFEVPTKLYPWVLMALIQVIMPNISLMGHLCGILAGFMYIYGALNWVFPSNAKVQHWEQDGFLRQMSRRSNYVRCPEHPPGFESSTNQQSATRGIRDMVSGFFSGIRSCLASVCGSSSSRRQSSQPQAGAAPRRVSEGVLVTGSSGDIESGQQGNAATDDSRSEDRPSLLGRLGNMISSPSRNGSYERVPTTDEEDTAPNNPKSQQQNSQNGV